MIIKSLIAALLIYTSLYIFLKKRSLEVQFIETKKARKVVGLAIILFFVLFYVIPVSYYFPHNNGVLGDNYLHLHWALSQPGFIKHHHPLFPLIPEKFIDLLIGARFLSVNDPMFLEEAYYWSVLPVSLGVVMSLLFFFYSLYKKGISNLLLITIVILFSVSYGFWLWGIQSNAIGLALATELLVATAFVHWYRTHKIIWLITLAILLGISVFMHNGLLYLAFGTYISFLWAVFRSSSLKIVSKLKEILTFSTILIIMGAGYYLFQANLNHTYSPGKLLSILSDSKYFGGFGGASILSSMESNFWSGVNWIIGFYYTTKDPYWSSVETHFNLPIGSLWVKAFQIGALLVIIMAAVISFIKKKQPPSTDLLVFGLINSIVFFVGFTLRQAGSHYYVLALVPNLILLTSFLIGNIAKNNNPFYIFPIAIIAFGCFYFNGFTKLSVFEGRNINDHPYYFENISILKATKRGEAIYFKKMDLEYYPNMTLETYYKNKFKNIQWITDWRDQSELERTIVNGFVKYEKVFLSREANETIDHSKYITKKLNDDLYLISNIANL